MNEFLFEDFASIQSKKVLQFLQKNGKTILMKKRHHLLSIFSDGFALLLIIKCHYGY